MISKVIRVNETKKMLPRINQVMKGKGIIIGREIDNLKMNDCDFLSIQDFISKVNLVSTNANFDEYISKYDYVLFIGFEYFFKNPNVSSVLKHVISFCKSNGYIVFYLAHPHFFPSDISIEYNIPHDILVHLKHIHEHSFEIIDYQTYCYDGPYHMQNHEQVEYAFQVILRKANDVFSKKKDLSDDPGQMVSLDD